jgi:hypothetical protein
MKPEEIIEGNKLIAVFMGNERNRDSNSKARFKHWAIEGWGWFDDNDLRYHTSWEWLMPVVDRIIDLHHKSKGTALGKSTEFDNVLSQPIWTPKTELYKAVVRFIQWLNQQAPSPKEEAGEQ